MTSHAKTISPTPIDAASPRQDFDAAKRGAEQERAATRDSDMVRNEQPKPSLKPSLALSLGPDGTAFDAAWEREQRRAAFIEMRTDPQTGGRVRVLNKTFNR